MIVTAHEPVGEDQDGDDDHCINGKIRPFQHSPSAARSEWILESHDYGLPFRASTERAVMKIPKTMTER